MSLAIRPFQTVRDGRRQRVGDGAKPAVETRLERFSKLLPADAIAIYIPALGLGTLADWPPYTLLIMVCSAALVPLLLYLDARSTGDRVLFVQYVVRTLTFLSWVFVINPSVAPIALEPHITSIAAIALPLGGVWLVRMQLRPW